MRTLVILAILWGMGFIQFMTGLGTGHEIKLLYALVIWIVMILYLFRRSVIAWFNKLWHLRLWLEKNNHLRYHVHDKNYNRLIFNFWTHIVNTLRYDQIQFWGLTWLFFGISWFQWIESEYSLEISSNTGIISW
jgi:hypothetical protein